jgi:hypothetical protein
VGSAALSRAHFCVWCHFLLPRPGSHAAQSSPQPGSIGTPKNGVSNGASRVERRVALMSEMASPLPDSSLTHRDTARLLLPRDSAVRRCFIRRSPMSSPSTVSLLGLSLPRSRSPAAGVHGAGARRPRASPASPGGGATAAASICPPWHVRAPCRPPVLDIPARPPQVPGARNHAGQRPSSADPWRGAARWCYGRRAQAREEDGSYPTPWLRLELAPASPWAEGQARSATPSKCSTECQQER